MEPWYKIVTPRKEVREGRSFNPDEFAIHLEQVVSRTAPDDYKEPQKFFSRTCFTRALREHSGMVLRRLAGETNNTAPVLTLVTQFGGGKTHTLTALFHLANTGAAAAKFSGIAELLEECGLATVPSAKVGVFVGNAWDPMEGRENPWLDLAHQLAGDAGILALGPSAKTTPPGTEALARLFEAAGGSVLILMDEVLNFINRHRAMSEHFHAFLQNLTVAMTGTTSSAAVISLPRSQVEMTDWDLQWQERITKVVRRVAKDLIVNDEAEISEVIRRRLFEDLGNEKLRKQVAKSFANWCFDRRAQLPREWTAVDSTLTESKAKEFLQSRFECCYPFHPSTLSVFQRKWQTLPQYQQTRGTLAMLAQWISWAYRDSFTHARRESLITLGSAPLDVPEVRSVILGQLGESRLIAAIDADIVGPQAHARVLDADTRGSLRDIHRRVGTAVLFESSGGQIDKVAHLPELRFALGEPDIDTTSVDTAALTLEASAYYIRKVGSDGLQIKHVPTLKKVVSDRRASLDEDNEVRPAARELIKNEFAKGKSINLVFFAGDGTDVPDTPKLTLIVLDPSMEWVANNGIRKKLAEWMKQRGLSPRLYPASLIWCLKKPGRELIEKVELLLAWKRVKAEIEDGTIGGDFDRNDKAELDARVIEAEKAAKDEIWASYRFLVLADEHEPDGLRIIDLGAGHANSGESLCARVIVALKSHAILNESVGAGYIERNWPKALKDSGAWPLSSLRQCFLDGSLTRLEDPDSTLRLKIAEFVAKGEFGLASGLSEASYRRVWFTEMVSTDEIVFDSDVYLLLKEKAAKVKQAPIEYQTDLSLNKTQASCVSEAPNDCASAAAAPPSAAAKTATTMKVAQKLVKRLELSGTIPPEIWNRLGTKIMPKIKMGDELIVGLRISASFDEKSAEALDSELTELLGELNLSGSLKIDWS